MTLPDERKSSMLRTRKFLVSLLNPKATPKVPLVIRKQAASCLRHYPWEYHIDKYYTLEIEKGVRLGLNKKEVVALIGKERWKEFAKWMYGQTCGYEDGVIYYYPCDVERFRRGLPVID